ncbi:hypothetical protein BV898_09569 [Hypsibius exemplaris]|uniref:Ig-like domain-containing protein n=1 Tax=Hypsibius exemplaris TaxID=2072580 RepID=A0A1W0WM14_HYPEX|nr:hypothetical protein BV898_09569 [Hypsibius exemplaris]
MALERSVVCCFALSWSLLLAVIFTTTTSAEKIEIKADYTGGQVWNGVTYFNPSDSLDLNCITTAPGPTSWTLTVPNQPPATVSQGSGARLHLEPTGSGRNMKPVKGGQYSCTVGNDTADYYVNVLDGDSLIPKNLVANGTAQTAYLRCEQRFRPEFPLIWTRRLSDGTEIVLNGVHMHPDGTTPDMNYTVNVDQETPRDMSNVHDGKKNWTLKIRSHEGRYPMKTGEYQCKLNTTGTTLTHKEIIKTVVYEATPDVKIDGTAQSQTATKEDRFSLTCIYSGSGNEERVKWVLNGTSRDSVLSLLQLQQQDPQRHLGWQVLVDFNETFAPCREPYHLSHPDRRCLSDARDPDHRFSLMRDRHYENSSRQQERTSILEIRNVTDSDRGQYYCFVENEHGVNSGTVFVRVKDRWAALWPFLGILAELVLLALIICICERRRSRTLEQEEEAKPLNETTDNDRSTLPADNAAVRNRK